MEIKNKSIIKFLYFWFFVLICFTSFALIPGWIIKYYHIVGFLIFFSILLFKEFKIRHIRFSKIVLIFFIIVIAYSIVGYIIYKPHFLLINFLFAFLSFSLGTLMFDFLTKEEVFRIFENATKLVLIVVFFKNIVFIDEIVHFLLNPWGHPYLPFFIAGGPNIESSIIVMNTIFLVKHKKWFYFSFFYGILISLAYASRTATILCFFTLFLYLISDYSSVLERKRWKVFSVVFIFLLVFIGSFFIENVYTIKRFTEIGEEPGSLGRLALWEYAFDAVERNLLQGYGAGNSIYAISSISGNSFRNDNLHNLYLQYLVDFGVLGLLAYLFFNYEVFLRFLKKKNRTALLIWIVLFIIASFLQFRGSDAIFWFIIGCFYGEKKMFNPNPTFQ